MRIEKLSDAKNNLSRLIEEVRRGERIRIVVRGRAVADLVPIDDDALQPDLIDARLADLERRGLIRRGTSKLDPLLLQPGPSATGTPLSTCLIEERRQGR